MPSEPVQLSFALKGELLKETARRFPEIDLSAVQLATALKNTSKALDTLLSARLATYKLSEGKFYVLCHLMSAVVLEQPAPGPSEIAERLGVTRATVTGLLDGLERDGYLERSQEGRDRRTLSIRITDQGRSFMGEFTPLIVGSVSEALSGLDPAERRVLGGLLGRIRVGGKPASEE